MTEHPRRIGILLAIVVARTGAVLPGEETVSQPPDTFNSDVPPADTGHQPSADSVDTDMQSLQDDAPQPVNCVVGEWEQWSKCSKTCGHGIETRTRTVVTEAGIGGMQCPALQEDKNCMVRSCPVPATAAPTHPKMDCQVGSWSEWSKCTATCGSGFESRSRSVITDASHGGAECPPLAEDKNCDIRPCPPPPSTAAVDCQVGQWSPWSQCSQTCGTGFHRRSRIVVNDTEFGGATCPILAEDKDCVLIQECPAVPTPLPAPVAVDCELSVWSGWTKCTKTCGSGVEQRSRYVIVEPAFSGMTCPSLAESKPCMIRDCPVIPTPATTMPPVSNGIDCIVDSWQSWSTCSKTCGHGTEQRTRTIITDASDGGAPCPSLEEANNCMVRTCPNATNGRTNCAVSTWTSWNKCSKTCGSGFEVRTRTVSVEPSGGGSGCPSLSESHDCHIRTCPAAPTFRPTPYVTAVTQTEPPLHEDNAEHDVTVTHPPVQSAPAAQSPANIQDDDEPTEDTNNPPSMETPPALPTMTPTGVPTISPSLSPTSPPTNAALDCDVSTWGSWGQCSEPCNGGIKSRVRTVQMEAQHGGLPCPITEENMNCNTHACVHCEHVWKMWSVCTRTCGNGTQSRLPMIFVEAGDGGRTCPNKQERVCNTEACPTPTPSQSPTKKPTKMPTNFPTQTPTFAPVHCSVSSWSTWSICSEVCNSGVQSHSRQVTVHATFGGAVCPPLFEQRNCNTQACPVDCEHSWTNWTVCSRSCGGGTQSKYLAVVREPQHGGEQCPNDQERVCNTEICPTSVPTYSPTPSPSVPATRMPTPAPTAALTALLLPFATQVKLTFELSDVMVADFQEEKETYIHAIAETFEVSESVVSITGIMTARRRLSVGLHVEVLINLDSRSDADTISQQITSGEFIGTLVEELAKRSVTVTSDQITNAGVQVVAGRGCEMSSWEKWTSCSEPCGLGVSIRHRTVVRRVEDGGSSCPATVQQRDCHVKHCPQDCVHEWGEWDSCTVTCGGGVQERFPQITTTVAHGGEQCPGREERICNTEICATVAPTFSPTIPPSSTPTPIPTGGPTGAPTPLAQDCKISGWGNWSQCSEPCGTGVHMRMRQRLVFPMYGGRPCPSLLEGRNCNTNPCPIDCLHTWLPWTECTKTCGEGIQSRPFTVHEHAAHGGHQCPTQEERVCNTEPCEFTDAPTPTPTQTPTKLPTVSPTPAPTPQPVHCRVAEWGSWSECSEPCNTGVRMRTRRKLQANKYGGRSCPILVDTANCNEHECPIDCQFTWEEWSSCSTTCGAGIQVRFATVHSTSSAGGEMCPDKEERVCANLACPTGTPTGTPTTPAPTVPPPTPVPAPTPPVCLKDVCTGMCEDAKSHCCSDFIHNFGMCNKCVSDSCPTPAALPAPTPAPPLCKPGNCNVCEAGRSNCCSAFIDMFGMCGQCNDQFCPVGDPLTASPTSVPTPVPTEKPTPAPTATPTQWPTVPLHVTSHVCKLGSCTVCEAAQVHCCSDFVENMGMCGNCASHFCAAVTPAPPSEAPTSSPTTAPTTSPTSVAPTAAPTGKPSSSPTPFPSFMPTPTPTPTPTLEVDCSPNTCTVGNEECRKHCCNAFIDSMGMCPTCVQQNCPGNPLPTPGPTAIPTPAPTSVPTRHQPINCKLNAWNAWTNCSEVCGGGYKTRQRSIETRPNFGGAACESLFQMANCNEHPCPVDCEHEWEPWKECSKTCGTGVQRKEFKVVRHAMFGGTACPMSEERTCNSNTCPTPAPTDAPSAAPSHAPSEIPTAAPTTAPSFGSVDCLPTPWSAWSVCSEECGAGVQTRNRSIAILPEYGGSWCPATKEERDCNVQQCPVHCHFEWGPWSPCDVTCGGGISERHPHITQWAQYGGEECKEVGRDWRHDEERTCSIERCPSEAPTTTPTPSPTMTPTIAPTTSPTNTPTQAPTSTAPTATPTNEPSHAPTEMPTAHPTSSPTGSPTKNVVDCVLTDWEAHGNCSSLCDEGVQVWTREVLQTPKNGGHACEALTSNRRCNLGACSARCTREWGSWSGCNAICGNGTQYRVGRILHSVLAHLHISPSSGNAFTSANFICPTKEQRICNENQCPTMAPTPAPTPLSLNTPICTAADVVYADMCRAYSVKDCTSHGSYIDEDSGEAINCILSTIGQQGDDDDDDLTSGPIVVPSPDCKDDCPACCTDGSGGGLHQNCGDEDPVLRDYARKTCRKTCGVCVLPTKFPTAYPTSQWANRQPTNVPTPMPTFENHHLLPKCHVKDQHFEHGWQGGGLDENYCNLCRCHMGMMICTRKKCGIPSGLPVDATKCLHLTCSYMTAPDPKDYQVQLSKVIVHHKREERHKQHKCAYNKWDEQCTCYCWDLMEPDRQVYATPGRHRFGGLVGFLSQKCENVVFPNPYNPSKGDMNVVVTVAHTNDVWVKESVGHHEHDPAIAWVETSSHTGFTVCARADEEYWHAVWDKTKGRHEHFVDIDYYAWQGSNQGTEHDISGYSPFGGAQSDSTLMILPGLRAGDIKCNEVPFGAKFSALNSIQRDTDHKYDPSPLVFGSIDRKYHRQDLNTIDRVAVTHWFNKITDDRFEVCFQAFSEEHEVPIHIKADVPPQATQCLKMTCKAKRTTPGRALVTVSHVSLEPHQSHRCGYDDPEKQCQCMCWDPISEDDIPVPQPLYFNWMAFQPAIHMRYNAPYRASGRHAASGSWKTYKSIIHEEAYIMCDIVPISATITQIPIVLASASVENAHNRVQHGLMTWIDEVHMTRFKVCTILSAEWFSGAIDDVKVIWDWVAFEDHPNIRESLAP